MLAALFALAAGPVSSASAAVVMESSPGGTTTSNATPTFGGSTEDLVDPVTVNIYAGASATGAPVQSLTTSSPPLDGSWSLTATSPLADGTYTAIAEQMELGGLGEDSVSAPQTFTVDTASPTVTLNSPVSPSNDTTPSFTGSASGTEEIVVEIYAGSRASGPPVAQATAEGDGGDWSSAEASPALSGGEYTAVAFQKSSLGNPTGESNPVSFLLETSSPSVTLEQPPSPSNDTTPSFSGTASDTTDITVKIYQGATTSGTLVASASATGTGGSWRSDGASPALSSGQYTAVATQPSPVGNPAGTSNTVSFAVETAPPTVTLNPPASPSNDTTPSFTGYASDTEALTIRIYAGTTAQGPVVSTATAEGNGGDWRSGSASPALASGQYTAVATQPSSLGNSAGTSNPVTFTLDTSPPQVTLNQPRSPSNDTTPSFTGTASEAEQVSVRIYAGGAAEGTVVSSAAATGTGAKWSSGDASPALASGEYTAIATQNSSLGNGPGTSSPVTFYIDTSSPTVTLNEPPTPTRNTTPSFTGTASASTEVVVRIYAGTQAEGSEVSSARAAGTGGSWSSANASPALPGGTHTFTAIATQESPLGNPEGRSAAVRFTVNTAPPNVTLNSPALLSNDTKPSFSGTASDTTPVTVHLYRGTRAEGSPVATLTAQGTGGAWASEAVSPALSNGRYTAVATQPSSLGNASGTSNVVGFEVDTESPTVTLNAPTSPSNDTAPSFSGTASETTPVSIQIFEGAKAEGAVVATASATGTGGGWTSSNAAPTLPSGRHTFTALATQASPLKNAAGKSAPVTFEVDTRSPTVTLNAPASLSNDRTPSFSGAASETTPVSIQIFEGAKAEGAVVATASATGTGGGWTSSNAGPELPSGRRTFTALATQRSSLGNPDGTSSPVTFTVDTSSPTVTLNQPLTPSNNRMPSFRGTASDTTPVTIQIYEGTKAEGSEVARATAAGNGASWSSGDLSPALASGTHTYTAQASQASSLGNIAGKSEPVTFTVNTLAPLVTLNAPPSPSNNTSPSFSGTASDTTPVLVKIYENPSLSGSPRTVSATPLGGRWSSAGVTPALAKQRRTYCVIATQESSIAGNPPGRTSPPICFAVDPNAPTVTLDSPTSPSNNTTPSFTGTASDSSPVSVEIYAGASRGGKPVALATAVGTFGAWTTGPATPALADGQYTAVASQRNRADEREQGVSQALSFTVDTVAPTVTLSSPAEGSSTESETQVLSGLASVGEGDLPPITVQLFSGASIQAGQTPVQSITVDAVGETWSGAFAGLSAGTYAVRAEQADDAGNVGISVAHTFTVVRATGTAVGAPAAPGAPTASFSWFPSHPHTNELISFASSSADAASPIAAFAWDLDDAGAFAVAGPTDSTSFSTPGDHVVRLRVTDANGLSSVASQTIPVEAAPLPLMQPFPLVRITSTSTRSGIRLRLLSVIAPAGANITVRCAGHGCPRSQSRVVSPARARSASVEFRQFQRSFAAGVVLEVRVSKSAQLGKYTRLTVRRGKLPLRLDRCVAGTGAKPVVCP